MTERFELKGVERQFLWDNKNVGNMAHWIANKISIVDLLNELNDENEQLKQQIKDMQIRFKRKYDYEFDEIVDELDLGDVE